MLKLAETRRRSFRCMVILTLKVVIKCIIVPLSEREISSQSFISKISLENWAMQGKVTSELFTQTAF